MKASNDPMYRLRFQVQSQTLKRALKFAIVSALIERGVRVDGTTSVGTGVNMRLTSNKLEICGTDGHRASYYNVSYSRYDCINYRFSNLTISVEDARELIRLIPDNENYINVRDSERHIVFEWGDDGNNSEIVFQLHPDPFPQVSRTMLPDSEYHTMMEVNRTLLLENVGLFRKLLGKNSPGNIDVSSNDDQLILTSHQLEIKIPADLHGLNFKICIPVNHLFDGMNILIGSTVKLIVKDNLTPVLFRDLATTTVEDCTYLAMPVVKIVPENSDPDVALD